jgi:hypothetical protein
MISWVCRVEWLGPHSVFVLWHVRVGLLWWETVWWLKVSGVERVDGGRISEPYEKVGAYGGGDAAPDPCEVSAVCVPVVSCLLLKSVSTRFYMLCPK